MDREPSGPQREQQNNEQNRHNVPTVSPRTTGGSQPAPASMSLAAQHALGPPRVRDFGNEPPAARVPSWDRQPQFMTLPSQRISYAPPGAAYSAHHGSDLPSASNFPTAQYGYGDYTNEYDAGAHSFTPDHAPAQTLPPPGNWNYAAPSSSHQHQAQNVHYQPQTPIGYQQHTPLISSHHFSDARTSPSLPIHTTTSHPSRPTALFEDFERRLSLAVHSVQAEKLHLAAPHLLDVTRWLLGNAVNFGLSEDDEVLDPLRLKLWRDFNYTWLAFVQKQKDIITEELNRTRSPRASSTRMSSESLDQMHQTLSRYCDPLDDLGLVDWERGVWEGQIGELIKECLELARPIDRYPRPTTSSSSHSASNTPGSVPHGHSPNLHGLPPQQPQTRGP